MRPDRAVASLIPSRKMARRASATAATRGRSHPSLKRATGKVGLIPRVTASGCDPTQAQGPTTGRYVCVPRWWRPRLPRSRGDLLTLTLRAAALRVGRQRRLAWVASPLASLAGRLLPGSRRYCRGVRSLSSGAGSKLLRKGLISMPPRRRKRAYTVKRSGLQRSAMSMKMRSTQAS